MPYPPPLLPCYVFSSAEKLDLEQERPVWTPVAPMVTRRCTLGVAVVNGSLYAIGGFDGTNGLESTERFDPGKWTGWRRGEGGGATL